MEFKYFANKLHDAIEPSTSTHAFTKALFTYIVDEADKEIISKKKDGTYKSYFNGKTSISKIAKEITFRPGEFNEYIQNLDATKKKNIVNAFSDDVPGLTTRNVTAKLSALFEEIITAAAETKRKSPSKDKAPSKDKQKTTSPDVSSAQMIAIQSFSKKYYQLIVSCAEEIFESNIVTMRTDRSLTKSDVPEEIFERCSSLTGEGISELKTFPAIICNENTELKGITDANQRAVYGYVRKIQQDGRNIKILFEPLGTFKQTLMCDKTNAIFFDLHMDCAVTTLNRTAWSVHRTNLFEAFKEAGISDMPMPD